MYRLLEFVRSVYLFLLFIILEGSAIYIYVKSDSYARAKMLGYTSSVVGGVEGTTRSVVDYFSLHRENRELLDRIAYLEEQLVGYNEFRNDSLLLSDSYFDDEVGATFQAARVVSNTINRRHNYMVINRGLEHGVRAGMAVVTPRREIVGVVMECSDGFSVVMSALNTRFRTSGRIEGDTHAGGLYWDGRDRYRLKMQDLSKYAQIEVGDKVVTTSFSQIFPAGVTIGRVAAFEFDPKNISYNVDIDLAADISGVDRVLVVNYNLLNESRMLLDRVDQDPSVAGEVIDGEQYWGYSDE